MCLRSLGLICLLMGIFLLSKDFTLAGLGGIGFESRIQSLTNSLISVMLPTIAILGLVYAAIQAAMGDEGAKKRMLLVIVACMIGFLAPMIIRWFQSAVGG